MHQEVHGGTAGWPLPTRFSASFPGPGPLLERYGRGLGAVEINTTFYRLHRPETFAKWASPVPEAFRFSVKAPRFATHCHRLGPGADLGPFLEGALQLGSKLGPVLIQLPPSLAHLRQRRVGRGHGQCPGTPKPPGRRIVRNWE